MIKISSRFKMIAACICFFGLTGVLFTNCSQTSFTARVSDDTIGALLGIGSKGDPFVEYAWHLNNTGQKVFASSGGTAGVDLNLLSVWGQGIYGKGIRILISDDAVEDLHEDLVTNYLYSGSKDYRTSSPYTASTSRPYDSNDNHGTAVAGLIAATAGNGYGSSGVAPLAQLANTNFLSNGISQTNAVIADQASSAFDIVNMSWGSVQNSLPAPTNAFFTQLLTGISNGRNGKGSLYVKAAGNDFFVACNNNKDLLCVGNSNFDPDNSTPYTILTAALDANGIPASYSSAGSNVWISSFGGEFGNDTPAMITTDRSGCSVGFSATSVKSVLAFDKGQSPNSNCNYTATFNGTSSAAPVLTGVVALILEANPNLTWRDVKYILAKTATVPSSATTSISHQNRESVPTGYVWEQGWITNGAGFKFHNWYGFGRVNTTAAVALAKSYGTTMNAISVSSAARSSLNLAIPDNSAVGVSDTVNISSSMKVEAVRISITATHPNISELAVELTSPRGTKSIIVNMKNSLRGIANFTGNAFLSNAFYQELASGNWTLKVLDGGSGNTGTVTGWTLDVYGSN